MNADKRRFKEVFDFSFFQQRPSAFIIVPKVFAFGFNH